jgi:DNA polymerase-4
MEKIAGSPLEIAARLRQAVRDRVGLPVTVGVARSKFLAKVASAAAKPDGLLLVQPEEEAAFLHPLPVGALWGVGHRTEEQLTRLGLRTVGDLAQTPAATLERALGTAVGRHLADLAWGRDPRSVVPHEPDRSVGAEETFGTDVDDPTVVRRELLRLSERVGGRLRAQGYRGRTVSIKIRFADFTTITRSRTLRDPTDVTQDIYATALDLYEALGLDRARLRLVGVRVEGLADADAVLEQLQLGAPEHGWRDADAAIDRAAQRFGRGAVRPAALVQPDPGP